MGRVNPLVWIIFVFTLVLLVIYAIATSDEARIEMEDALATKGDQLVRSIEEKNKQIQQETGLMGVPAGNTQQQYNPITTEGSSGFSEQFHGLVKPKTDQDMQQGDGYYPPPPLDASPQQGSPGGTIAPQTVIPPQSNLGATGIIGNVYNRYGNRNFTESASQSNVKQERPFERRTTTGIRVAHEGMRVYAVDASGGKTLLENGIYTMQDGEKLEVRGGKKIISSN